LCIPANERQAGKRSRSFLLLILIILMILLTSLAPPEGLGA
jgi:hypothetical protein